MARIIDSSVQVGTRRTYYGSVPPDGWLFADGRTIGNTGSGGTSRASTDCFDLFSLIWNSFDISFLVIQDSSGSPTTKGVSASADFTALKRIGLPDLRGRSEAGKDDMGGTPANRITTGGSGISGNKLSANGGEETHTLLTAEMPQHTHVQNSHNHTQDQHNHTQTAHVHGTTESPHSHGLSHPGSIASAGGDIGNEFVINWNGNNSPARFSQPISTGLSVNSTTALNQPTVATNQATTAVNQNTGNDGPHNNMQPVLITNMIIKF